MAKDIITDVADEAMAHKHSVEKRLAGLPVRGKVGERIDASLARRGITPPSSPLKSTPPPSSGRTA